MFLFVFILSALLVCAGTLICVLYVDLTRIKKALNKLDKDNTYSLSVILTDKQEIATLQKENQTLKADLNRARQEFREVDQIAKKLSEQYCTLKSATQIEAAPAAYKY